MVKENSPRTYGSSRQTRALRLAAKSESPTRTPFDPNIGGLGPPLRLAPLVVGIVDGLAGSAAVALLVISTIHDSWWAIACLLLFGIGHRRMMFITALLAMPFAFTGRTFSDWNHGMAIA